MKILLALAFIGVVLAVALWDLFCVARGTPSDTVSIVLQDWSRQWPMLPASIGMVIGHVLWPTR